MGIMMGMATPPSMVYVYVPLYILTLYIHCVQCVYTYPLSQIHVFLVLEPLPLVLVA